jgi:hypothetical protein
MKIATKNEQLVLAKPGTDQFPAPAFTASQSLKDAFRALQGTQIASRSTAAARAIVAVDAIRLQYPWQLEAMQTLYEAKNIGRDTRGRMQAATCLFAPSHTGKTIAAQMFTEAVNEDAELHPAFEAEELSMFAKAWKAQIPARAVAHRFSLPNYAIEQCAQLNLLEPSPLVLPHTGYAFKADQIERLASHFSPNMTEPQSSAMCLKDAMRQVSGRLKPWGLILSQICNGSLPAVITEGPDDRLISRIWIAPTAFENILSSHFQDQKDCVQGLSEMVPQADALEILNCSATSAGVLQGLDSQGLNPKLFRLDQVVQRAREVVATSDIAARFQLDNTRTYHLLRTAKIREVVPSGWDRQAAFQLVARNNALKAAQLALEF